jgi:hypothetical protein
MEKNHLLRTYDLPGRHLPSVCRHGGSRELDCLLLERASGQVEAVLSGLYGHIEVGGRAPLVQGRWVDVPVSRHERHAGNQAIRMQRLQLSRVPWP